MPDIDDVATMPGTDELERAQELCLAVSTGGPFQVVALPERGKLVIGRASTADVRIDDPSVSREHAELRCAGGIYLRDLKSSNGVWIQGKRIEPDAWVPLGVGQLASLGAAMVIVRPRRGASGRPRRIWSHGYFEGRVEEEVARSQRSSSPFGLVRVSVPRRCEAATVEDVLASRLRVVDVLARYAPHEYEVLFVEQPPDAVAAAVERLSLALTERLGCARHELGVGIACYPRDASAADALLSRACDAVIGRSDAAPDQPALARPLREQIERIAPSEMSVLLLGETGVGKEVCAQLIHERSRRSAQKLLRLNCAALSESLLETELFGHEQGAFTGAVRAKPGLFETADGGTVFLDEIGELPHAIQVKLLRVLEERTVQRVGALEPLAIDVRFISATNRDLDAEVAAGRFRQDLLFRINTFTLSIPPLRERRDEIDGLARRFIRKTAEQEGFASLPALSPEARASLLAYSWPGNVRELRNVIERAVVLCGGGSIGVEHLPVDKMSATVVPRSRDVMAPAPPEEFAARVTASFSPVPREGRGRSSTGGTGPTLPPPFVPGTDSLRDEVDELERQRILAALDETAGNQTRAAKMLGISRGTLVSRLDRYGIPRPRKRRR